MKPAAMRVQAAIEAAGLDRRVVVLGADARTSQEAADALGVTVGQIAKSIVFTVNQSPVMVIASGAHRVDEAKLAALVGGRVRRADPETARQATGYAIGGIPPVGHATALPVFVDRDLMGHALIYAAAGVPDCVFPLTPEELLRTTGGILADVKVDGKGGSR